MDPISLAPVVIFAVIWNAIYFMVSRASGWNKLAEKYGCADSFMGSWKRFQWAQVGLVNYKNCIWLGIAPDGLYVTSGPLIFKCLYHRQVRIPWSAIESVRCNTLWGRNVAELTITGFDKKIKFECQSLEGMERFLEGKLPETSAVIELKQKQWEKF
jgi:hypothetical protein